MTKLEAIRQRLNHYDELRWYNFGKPDEDLDGSWDLELLLKIAEASINLIYEQGAILPVTQVTHAHEKLIEELLKEEE